ncbi:MAG: DUF6475 domain-containing protein [Candidatus Eisenbacteria bacterium]|nr:DUF6475 domain-containing protein [Candidatus Eisenbacteria bacterium]
MTPEGMEKLFDLIEGASRITMTPKQRDAYDVLLADQDDKSVLQRCLAFYRSPAAAMRKEKVPTPGDLIEQPRAKADAAAMAWATVRRAIGQVGSYRSVEFEDGAITASVEAMGGWVSLCDKSPKELDMLAWQFRNLYISLAGKCERKPLAGRHELQNRSNGHAKELEAAKQIPTLGSAPALPQLEEETT